jgi:hypothetical protein
MAQKDQDIIKMEEKVGQLPCTSYRASRNEIWSIAPRQVEAAQWKLKEEHDTMLNKREEDRMAMKELERKCVTHPQLPHIWTPHLSSAVWYLVRLA